jgi:HEAT repeat protein
MVVVALLSVAPGFSRSVSAQQYTFEEVASGLKGRDPATRLRAIQILKDADYAEAAGPIAANLADNDDRVQLAAIDAERSLFTARPVSRRRKIGFVVEVRSVAGGDSAEGRLALKPRTIPRELLGGLAAALLDDHLRVRAEAMNLTSLLAPVACVGLRPDSTLDQLCAGVGNALIENINSRQPALRRAAMQALGQLRYASAAQALADQWSYHQKGPDALAALEGLAAIGHPTSVSIFRQLLSSSNADMRRLAVEGLARAQAKDALTDLQHMGQQERSTGVLLAIHYAHVELGAPGGSLQAILGALRVPQQRPLALRYLLDLAPAIAPLLVASLSDESADLRRLVAAVLGFSREPEVVPALQAATKDADPDLAQAAQQAIARIHLH